MSEKVWFVMEHHSYEGSDVVSVHRTEAGATAERDRLQEAMDKANKIRTEWSYSENEDDKWPEWPDGVPDCDALTVSGAWEVSE